jgi:predicted GNAT family N-acyltransferase
MGLRCGDLPGSMAIIGAMIAPFRVRRADWGRDRTQLRQIREAVFVVEQGVPLALEWDGIDAECAHVLAEDKDDVAVGTGRLLPDGHIGRMAVLQSWRHRGVGSALLLELMSIAKERGMREVVLNAQIQASAFYERHGFVAEGESFLDAGIPHLRMRRSLG